MKVATILPAPYLHLEEHNDYHLCLAHLMGNKEYGGFFRDQAERGRFVMMDNGVVETGEPMPMRELIVIADHFGVKELVLPDALCDRATTLERGHEAITRMVYARPSLRHHIDLVAVPQGEDEEEWIRCVNDMLDWPVRTIGISRFTARFFSSRAEALSCVPELIKSDKSIHLLGCTNDPREIYEVDVSFPGRVRGVDSGIAAMYTQLGMSMSDGQPKPSVELEFEEDTLDVDLLMENAEWWRKRCLGLV